MPHLRAPDLKCVSMKIGKFGGVESALRFIVEAQLRGCEVWMSGMYDTGVARRVLASFETLPGVIMPGDIGEPTLYFDEDVTDPPYEVRGGYVMLNGSGRGDGLGCDSTPVLSAACAWRAKSSADGRLGSGAGRLHVLDVCKTSATPLRVLRAPTPSRPVSASRAEFGLSRNSPAAALRRILLAFVQISAHGVLRDVGAVDDADDAPSSMTGTFFRWFCASTRQTSDMSA